MKKLLFVIILLAIAVTLGRDVVAFPTKFQTTTNVPGPVEESETPVHAYTYSVETRGLVSSDVKQFERHVASTLKDSRGGSTGGVIEFRQVDDGGDFTVWLANSKTVPLFSSDCDADWSCHVAGNVIVNDKRWIFGSPTLHMPLDEYRHLAVNHEVGALVGSGAQELSCIWGICCSDATTIQTRGPW